MSRAGGPCAVCAACAVVVLQLPGCGGGDGGGGDQAPEITSTPPATSNVDSLYAYTVTATGSPAPTVTVNGLPGWLLFDDVDTISGTPADGDLGMTGTITITVSNGVAPDATQEFQIEVLPRLEAPQITSSPSTSIEAGSSYTYAITTTGCPDPTIEITYLPPWLVFNSSTATISGTPSAIHAGTTGTITVTAWNGVAPDATQSFSIDVLLAPTITSVPPTSVVKNQLYEYVITTTGYPDVNVDVQDLPAWLTFYPATDTVSGTPSDADVGTTGTITVTASNGVLPNDVQAFTIDVLDVPPDDGYEENDFDWQATSFWWDGTWLSEYGGEVGVQLDDDWYYFETRFGDERVFVKCEFSHAGGNIDIGLYDWMGGLLAQATSTTDDEKISFTPLFPGPEEFYILVHGDDTGNTYDLWWEGAALEDPYEENDVYTAAWDFTAGENVMLTGVGGEYGIQADEDWYEVTAKAGDTRLVVACIVAGEVGSIDVSLHDSSGTLVAVSANPEGNEVINYQFSSPGTYYVRVYGNDMGGEYNLLWCSTPDDDVFEENDDYTNAWDYTGGDDQWLFAYGGDWSLQYDDDWYEVLVPLGDGTLRAWCYVVRVGTGLGFGLYDAGGTLVDTGVAKPYGGMEMVKIDTDLIAAGYSSGGTFCLRVWGSNAGELYTLWWASLPPDDSYEENDTLGTAWDFSAGETQWLSSYGGEGGVQLDDDWYRIVVPASELLVDIQTQYVWAEGGIEYCLVDDAGYALDYAGGEDNARLVINVDFWGYPDGGTFYIRFFSAYNAGDTYDFMWEARAP